MVDRVLAFCRIALLVGVVLSEMLSCFSLLALLNVVGTIGLLACFSRMRIVVVRSYLCAVLRLMLVV